MTWVLGPQKQREEEGRGKSANAGLVGSAVKTFGFVLRAVGIH